MAKTAAKEEGEMVKLPPCRHGMQVFGQLVQNGIKSIKCVTSTCTICLEFGLISFPITTTQH